MLLLDPLALLLEFKGSLQPTDCAVGEVLQ